MSWQQIARSRRREWERKRAPKVETVAIELDTSRWEAALDFAFWQLTSLPKQDEVRPLSSRLVGE